MLRLARERVGCQFHRRSLHRLIVTPRLGDAWSSSGNKPSIRWGKLSGQRSKLVYVVVVHLMDPKIYSLHLAKEEEDYVNVLQ